MKKFLFLLCAVALTLVLNAGDSLIFDTSYDTYNLAPDKAGGSGKFYDFPEKDLQLRMFPGVRGKGNSLIISNSERLSYMAEKNFYAPQGTVSLWFQMVNYDLGNSKLQTFFFVTGNVGKWPNGYYFRLIKNGREWKDFLIAQLYYRVPGMDKAFSKQIQFKTDPKLWKKGTWHHVVLTWNRKHFAMYLDGVLHPHSRTSGPRMNEQGKGIPYDHPDVKFSDFQLPEMPKNARIYIGNVFRTANAQDKTAFDRIQFFNRPFSAQEVRKLYEEVMPPVPKEKKLNFAGIPFSRDPKVFVRCFMREPMAKPAIRFNAYADLRRYNDNLYVRLVSDRPCGRQNNTGRDGNIWEDDSFEVHLKSPAGEYYQWIINGRNAVWDRNNNNIKWNAAGLKTSVKHTASGWEASLVIPLRNIKPLNGLWNMDVCAAAATGRKNNYYRWSNVTYNGSFTATGEMMFLDKNIHFSPQELGKLEIGALDLQARGTKNVRAKVSYLPVSGLEAVFPGDIKTQPWKLTLPGGPQTLKIEASCQGKTVYRYQTDYHVDYPMEFTFNTQKKHKNIQLKIDFANAGSERLAKISREGVKGIVMLKNGKGKVLSKGTFSTRTPQCEALLPLPDKLAAGEYKIEARSGSMIRTIAYRVPLAAPYVEKVGDDDTVPEPWQPVVMVNKNTFKVWNRTYAFDNASPLPAMITAGGEKVFLKAPCLSLNGKTAVWKNRKVIDVRRDRIKFEGRGILDGIPVSYKSELWFDGMLLINWDLTPAKKTVLKDMKITYQLPEKFAKFALQPEYIPWVNNKVSVSLQPERSYKNNCLWLVGHEKGFYFWVKSNANWVNAPGEKPLTAIRRKDRVDVSLNIISKPAALEKKAAYTMVFQATPSRPLPENFRERNSISHGRCSEVDFEFGNTGCGMDRPRPDDASVFNGCYPRSFKEFATHTWKGRNYRNLMYTTPGHLSDYAPDFDMWDKNDQSLPGAMFQGMKLGVTQYSYLYCSNATDAPADLWSWWCKDAMLKLKNYNGLYFDLSTSKYCENTVHGCGGIDAFGQKFVSSDALGLRNFYMRCYKTAHKYGGHVMIHCHVAFLPMTHFCDFFAPGEDTCNICKNNFYYGYCEDIPLVRYQTDYNQYRSGVGYQFILQNGRAAGLSPNMKKERQLSRSSVEVAVAALTPMVVHDINTWGHYVHQQTVNKRWKINRAIRLGKAEFHGYWENAGVRSATPGVYASFYQWQGEAPYKVVIAAGNFKRKAQKAGLVIDYKKLGLDKNKAVFHELWSDKKLSAKDVEKLTISGASFVLIGIK